MTPFSPYVSVQQVQRCDSGTLTQNKECVNVGCVGSLIKEETIIAATYDFEKKKKIAKYLAGIEGN